jgi:hypothetical protein
MGNRDMAKEKPQTRRIGTILLLVLVVVSALLVIAEVSSNVINEVASYTQPVATTSTPLSSQVHGEPTPTLFEMNPLE